MEANVGLFAKDGGAIPLLGVEVEGEVLGAHMRVRVRQRYRNGEAKPVEAVYTFPLPSQATLIGFVMTCDGRRIEGVVKEREEAFAAYDEAIASGHGAALLEQERPNVFTASVGNLLPNEETVVEVEYLERVQADEGALRLMIPTLVAPRYIPGTPTGDRTAHGWADPTDRVPDADRITPPIGKVDYGVSLDFAFDLGRELEIESPSHSLILKRDGLRTRVSFSRREVALDRDIVIVARGVADEPLSTVAVHREKPGAPGFVSLAVVPDLVRDAGRAARQEVVFLIDVSGSMQGASIGEAQAALRLCLRHLREGDAFNVIAFASDFHAFAKKTVPFTQKTLEQADRWVAALVADGGTELLAPLLEAAKQAPDGVIVLLTDGQVGNEAEIAQRVLAERGRARLYSFGIGTNVSDWLLRELGRRTGGAVEFIHPGERIDEKVVAQFARAIAPRVTDVSVKFDGVEIGELAPSEPPPLVDGEPWVLFGKLESGLSGRAELRGKLDGRPFLLTIPIDAAEPASRPALPKLWAAERIRDLEGVALAGRRGENMKTRIVKLAVDYGIMSAHTSFVVIETRTGDRRNSGQPETRVIPVSLPAGWAMFEQQTPDASLTRSGALDTAAFAAYVAAPKAAPVAAAPTMAPPGRARSTGLLGKVANALSGLAGGGGSGGYSVEKKMSPPLEAREREAPYQADDSIDPLLAILGRQLASGLWDEGDGTADDDVRRMRATARALLDLFDLGVSSSHPLHGTQVKKAIEALLVIAPAVAAREPHVAELSLGVAWLVSSGRRTRKQIESAVAQTAQLAGLRVWLGDEHALRAHLDQLSVA